MAETQFDYVIVGAGSAGCALAERLTASGVHKVLLLEAGGEDKDRWLRIPLGIGKLITGSKYIWPFTTEPESELDGNTIYWPRGKVLGGSSSINGMVFVRGDAEQYDRWRDTGSPGWGYGDVLPYFRRLEDRLGGDPAYRGRGGPVSVIDVPHRDQLTEAFYQACIQQGIPANPDYNAETYPGVSYLQVSIRDGRRCSTAVAYLRPARGRSNLTIATDAQATGLIIEGNRATGVHYQTSDGAAHQAKAESEVILCAGPIVSPQLLELSGIGNPDILKNAGITPVVNLQGVGENLQDHLQVRITYECTLPITINDMLNSKWRGMRAGLQYMLMRRGLLSTGSVSVHAITPETMESTKPTLKMQLAHVSGADRYAITGGSGIDPHPGFTIGTFNLHPESRGTIHVSSADPMAPPKIHANYLSTERDLALSLAALKLTRQIAQQPALKEVTVREVLPGPDVATDEDLIAYIRSAGQTSWHPIGTCKMGSDAMAVVDHELKVHGIVGLRVADSSIFPFMTSSNTNAPSIMVGERCADLLMGKTAA
jgi:choline dehydrogenase